jgi:hypothetical protein
MSLSLFVHKFLVNSKTRGGKSHSFSCYKTLQNMSIRLGKKYIYTSRHQVGFQVNSIRICVHVMHKYRDAVTFDASEFFIEQENCQNQIFATVYSTPSKF